MQRLGLDYEEGVPPHPPTTLSPQSTLWLQKLPASATAASLNDAFQQWGGRVLHMIYDPVALVDSAQALIQLPDPEIVSPRDSL